MRVLGRVGYRVVRGDGGKEMEKVKKEELSRAKIKKAISRLKDEKAAGKMEYQVIFGNMKERSQRSGCGDFVIGYGMEKNGRKIGKKE